MYLKPFRSFINAWCKSCSLTFHHLLGTCPDSAWTLQSSIIIVHRITSSIIDQKARFTQCHSIERQPVKQCTLPRNEACSKTAGVDVWKSMISRFLTTCLSSYWIINWLF